MSVIEGKIKKLLSLYTCEKCAYCCRHERVTISPEDVRKNRKLKGAIQEYIFMDYGVLRLPCPFISEENKCSCYYSRPKACLNHPFSQKYPQYITISDCPYGKKIVKDLLEFCNTNGIPTEDAEGKDNIDKMDNLYKQIGVGQEESFMATSVPVPVFEAFFLWVTKKKNLEEM
jgi:Fe-S-cluster containining protein